MIPRLAGSLLRFASSPERAPLLVFLIFGGSLVGCRGVEIQKPPEDISATWRDRELFVTPRFDVLATRRSAVGDAHERVAAAAERFEAATGHPVPRGLVLAMDTGDAPLAGETAGEWLETMSEWHAAATGQPTPPSASRGPVGRDGEKVFETDEEAYEFAARLLAAAVPLDAEALALPPSLRDRSSWAAVVPTRRNSKRSIEASIRLMKSRVPWHKRLLLSTMLPLLRSRLEEELSRGVREQLFRAWVAALAEDESEARDWNALFDATERPIRRAPDSDFAELQAKVREAEEKAKAAEAEPNPPPGP